MVSRYHVGTRRQDHEREYVVFRGTGTVALKPLDPSAIVREFRRREEADALVATLTDETLWRRTAARLADGTLSPAPMFGPTSPGEETPMLLEPGAPGVCGVCDGDDARQRWGAGQVHDPCAVLVEEISRGV
jgi:hypothetical protein